MFTHIVSAKYKNEFQIHVRFNNGKEGEIDFQNELYGEIFEPLKNEFEFKKFRVNPETGTIECPNGADFAPEFLMDKLEET